MYANCMYVNDFIQFNLIQCMFTNVERKMADGRCGLIWEFPNRKVRRNKYRRKYCRQREADCVESPCICCTCNANRIYDNSTNSCIVIGEKSE